MSRIYQRKENGNWYYQGDDGRRTSMKKFGVNGELEAKMLANKWDKEAFYSRNGLVNPEKSWLEFKKDHLELKAPPALAEESYKKLLVAVKYFELALWPTEEERKRALVITITDDHIIRWRKARLANGQSPRSVDAEEGYLRPMLARAHRKGFLNEDPFSDVPKLRFIIPEPPHLSIAQANAFLDHISQHHPERTLMGLMAYETGMRVGELVHLRIEDINFMKGIAYLLPHNDVCTCYQCSRQKKPGWSGKAGVPRAIPLSPKAAMLLLNLFQERKTGNVFEVVKGTVMKFFGKVFEDAGIKVNGPAATHIFRHTLVTDMEKADCRPAVARRIVGHKDKSVTDGYTHIDGENELRLEYQKVLDWRAGQAEAQAAQAH